jgi:hypothetical protein
MPERPLVCTSGFSGSGSVAGVRLEQCRAPSSVPIVIMVTMMMVVILRQLDVRFPIKPVLFIHRLQQRSCIRDGLQQLGVRVGS